MQVPKAMIVDFLRQRGNTALADQAEQHLPEQVDPQEYSEALKRYGIDVPVLLGKLPGPLGALFRRDPDRDPDGDPPA
jgi:hypothetical protein